MIKSLHTARFARYNFGLLILLLLLVVVLLVAIERFGSVWATRKSSAAAPNDEATLLDGYRHVLMRGSTSTGRRAER